MTQEEAKQALKEACAERLKKQFGVLAENLIDESQAEATAQFTAACRNDIKWFAAATVVIEDIFKG